MMTGKDLVDGKLGALDHAGADWLGRPGPTDPARGRLQAARARYSSRSSMCMPTAGIWRRGNASARSRPSVVDFLNAQPARMAMVRQIPATATNDSVFPGQ